MKLISDSGCFRCCTKSTQLVYGFSWLSPVIVIEFAPRRVEDGMPVSRPRAMLMVARSSGRPSRLLRSASVTNSSISLPSWRVVPRTMAPAASSGVGPLAANASGLRNASIRPISLVDEVGVEPVDRLGQHRVAEAIDRVRKLRDDRRIDVGVVAWVGRRRRRPAAGSCARTPRTRDADTASRCRTWRPGTGARRSTAGRRSEPASTGTSPARCPGCSHSFRNARSLVAEQPRPWCARQGGCARSGTRGARR